MLLFSTAPLLYILAVLPSISSATASLYRSAPRGDLQIDVVRPVTCTRKTVAGDVIKVHYRGYLENGNVFDSSYEREDPIQFVLGAHQVITGWDQGLLDMCIGEARKLTIPPEMGYGSHAQGSAIPANSVLIFDTELAAIKGVDPPKTNMEEMPTFHDGDDAPEQQASDDDNEEDDIQAGMETEDPAKGTLSSESKPEGKHGDGKCHLLGPFAILVQGALGILALLSLVFKRWRESPRRPLKVWAFDVSKQLFGSVLLHVANLFLSMLSSGEFDIKAQTTAAARKAEPNPCSFYLLNLAIDTTIGIPVLVILLRLLHHAFSLTPLARPPQSIKSGHYGQPPRWTWWLKQSLIYFLGLMGMKLFVFFLFKILPWIAWVGDWALRWTEGNEAVQIAFVMFIFPVIMNAIQYYIIDTFIKEKDGGEAGQGDYQSVRGEEDSGPRTEGQRRREAEWDEQDHGDGDADSDLGENEPLTGRGNDALKEVDPTPISTYDSRREGGSSGSSTVERERERTRKEH